MTNTVICDSCHSDASRAKWVDLFKAGDKIIYVREIVPYDEDGTYHLDDLREVLESKGLTEDEIDTGDFLSMNEDAFTVEDISKAPIGVEDVGPYCLVCRALLCY